VTIPSLGSLAFAAALACAACERAPETHPATAVTPTQASSQPVALMPPDRPAPLADTDFVVQGITLGTPRADVVAKFGSADTTKYGGLVYPGFIVVFFRQDHVVEIRLTDSTMTTARGLRIGDPKARLARLYGITDTGSPVYQYFLGSDEAPCLAIDVWEERVSRIYIGSCWRGE
jgi:hypothetical protein